MIEQLEHQLALLWRAANQTGRVPDITDHVKRHLRILGQKPEIGHLALSIANLEARILDHQEAQRRGEQALAPKEMAQAVDMLQRAADARPPEEPIQPKENP